MADKNLNVIIKASDAYTRELSKAEKAFSAASGAITSAIKVGAIAGAAALGGLSAAAYKAVQAANEVDATERKLSAALGFTSQALLDQASALQKVTTFGDDQIVQAQAMIAMFIKDEEQIKQATKATLDFAAAKGIDLATAGDLIAKTLGSSTNALGRYGVEVEGAVGSTERLKSLTEGIAAVFGGQAAAAAETFGGKLQQIKNAYGDVWEELGFVITRNKFFIQGIDVVTGAFASLADKIKENRLWLMELTKSGIVSFVEGMGYALEVMRFFHNGWSGIKIVANLAIIAMAEGLRVLFESISLVLSPFKKLIDGWIWLNKLVGLDEFGAMTVNPLASVIDGGRAALEQFQLSSRDTFNGTIADIEKTNVAYDAVGRAIKGIATGLQNVQVAQVDIAAGAPIAARVIVDEESKKKEEEDAAKAAAATAKAAADAAAAQEAARGQLTGLVDPTISTPEDTFSQAWLGYQAQLAALDQYNIKKLQLMQAAGFSEAEIAAENAQMVIGQEQKKRDFQLAAASQTFGGLSNMMQNLTTLTGEEGGAAFKMMKGFAIAQTAIDTYKAAQGAYAAMAGIPVVGPALGVAAAAAAIVAGLARVRQISSIQPGGSSTVISSSGEATTDYSGGSYDSTAVPTDTSTAQATQNITINVQSLDPSSVNWEQITEDNIKPALENISSNRNVELNIKVASR